MEFLAKDVYKIYPTPMEGAVGDRFTFLLAIMSGKDERLYCIVYPYLSVSGTRSKTIPPLFVNLGLDHQ